MVNNHLHYTSVANYLLSVTLTTLQELSYLIPVTTLSDKWLRWIYTIIHLTFQTRKLRPKKATDLLSRPSSWQCSQCSPYPYRISGLCSLCWYHLRSLWQSLPGRHNGIGSLKIVHSLPLNAPSPHDLEEACPVASCNRYSLPPRGEGTQLVTGLCVDIPPRSL